ncbi:MAG: hypothetical protein DHS20C10_05170 [marine bacterium B5-7]|nr:MAG: hypothetical protein DHS20C10_05170 [marine bacterium B5-7]
MFSNATFTTAVALKSPITVQIQSGLNYFWREPSPETQLRTLSAVDKEEVIQFIYLLTEQKASPLYCEDLRPSLWECRLFDATTYARTLSFIALAAYGADLPLEFKPRVEWRGAPASEKPIFFAEYKKRQESRRSQDTALKQLSTDTSTEDKISTYVEHAHYWLNLADAVIKDVTYQTDHFALDVHIAAYFLHQAIKYYQHALYLDVSETLPKANDETAWAKPLGTLFNDDTRPFLRNELNGTWLQQYMRCLTELAQHDFAFHLKELHTQEEKLFAEQLSRIPATAPSSSPADSADDAKLKLNLF